MNENFKHEDNEKKYSDIFNMKRPTSYQYPKITDEERAAQFSSFAALVGYDDEIDETARITDSQRELSEDQKQELDEKLHFLNTCAAASPPVRITYFVTDGKKAGGSYICATGRFSRLDEYDGCVIINEKTKISIGSIYEIESPLFM